MIVRNWKKIIYTGIDPQLAGNPLTLGTVPVATGVKATIQMAALITNIHVVTKIATATVLNVKHYRVLFLGKFMGISVLLTVHPKDVCHFNNRRLSI
jgi:hypothetical protein